MSPHPLSPPSGIVAAPPSSEEGPCSLESTNSISHAGTIAPRPTRKLRRDDEIEVDVLSFDERGRGVAHHAGQTVLLRRGLPGDRLRVRITHRRRDVAEGITLERLVPSASTTAALCAHFGSCGGCTLQHLDYAAQLAGKRRLVEDALRAQGLLAGGTEVEPVAGADDPWRYRNKMEFTFASRRWVDPSEPANAPADFALGLHATAMYGKVVDITGCAIQDEAADRILASARELARAHELSPWDVHTHTGLLRHLVLRTARGVLRTEPGVQQPALGLQQPAPGLQHVAPGLQHVAPGVQYVAPGLQQPALGLQQPALGLQQPALGLQQPALGLQHTAPDVQHTALGRETSGAPEILVNLVTSADAPEKIEPYARDLIARHPEITTLVQNVNTRLAATAIGERERVLHGRGFLYERLQDLVFAVSANSFFQTNPRQAERLFTIVREEARLTGAELVFDLYCGTGSIALLLAHAAREVVGFEQVASSVLDARRNAELNGITNARFVEGDVLLEIARADLPRPDVCVVDPPRAGLHPKVVPRLVALAPARIVYVSCNPVAAARDLSALATAGYAIDRIRPVDLFPHTPHIECVVSLARRNAGAANTR